ncbi:hypothetical protein Tco_1364191 [Tanacetum coccineum]
MGVFREKWEILWLKITCVSSKWLKFKNHEFSSKSQKEFRKKFSELTKKEIERPEALDIDEFSSLHEGIALQNLNQLCHVSYTQDDRTFTSQAWNRLFRIQEQVIREGIRRSRHSGKEKVTLDDLFLLHSMDGGARVDVPWHVARFFTDKAKGYKKKSPIVGAHLIGRIARSYGLITSRYNGLGLGELVDDLPNNEGNEAADTGATMDERLGTLNSRGLCTPSTKIRIRMVRVGVNFMFSTPVYSIALSSSPNLFGLFDNANAGPSTSQNQGNDMDKE